MKKRFGIIANPVAGKGRVGKLLEKLRHITEAVPEKFDFFHTEYAGHGTELASRIYKEYDAVIAVGGDGTANEVMSGLQGTETPFGLIPEGTGNDFARTLYMPSNLQQAVQIITEFKTRKMDIGTMNNRIFLNGVGIGFDAYVNQKKHEYKNLKGPIAYLVPVLVGLFTWKPIAICLEVDGRTIDCDLSFLLAVGNGWACGGGLTLNPKADIHDGFFDICQISDISVLKVISNLAKLKNGTIDKLKEVNLSRGRKITISSSDPAPIHFDGEIFNGTSTELNITVMPAAATVIGGWA